MDISGPRPRSHPGRLEIVRLLLAGKSNKEIEDALFIALATVKNHVHNIFQKMKVNNRLQLLLRIEQEAKKFK